MHKEQAIKAILSSKCRDYNVMIDGKIVFDQPVKSNKIKYENIRKITTGRGYYYTTGFLLDCSYFRHKCKMIAIYLSKQQALDAYRKAIQQINFTVNLDCVNNTRIFFMIEEKETV